MKKITKIIILITIIINTSGCIKVDNMDNIKIYTTNYPSYYITKKLYGKFSKVKSIYPAGVNIDEYSLTKKQIKDYSKVDLFIFNGLSKEKKYITKMRKNNKELKIIDTTLSMEYTNDINELWLNPSNFLMMAQNIKKGFNEYIDSYYLNSKIDENYEKLKLDISNLDAKFQNVVDNATSKKIAVSSNMFKYLEKYGLTVYVLDENDSNIDITISEVKSLIKSGEIKYIFIKQEENEIIKNLKTLGEVETVTWNNLENLSEEQTSQNSDYLTLMNENLNLLKNELYN